MKTTKILTFIILLGLTSTHIYAQSPAAAKLALDAGTLDKAKEKLIKLKLLKKIKKGLIYTTSKD